MIKKFIASFFKPIFFRLVIHEDRDLLTVGKDCPWTFKAAHLNSESHIVSAGVGGDITFELELANRFGCQIVLLDPSPTGLRTIQSLQPLPEQIEFLPVGLAGTSEIHSFSDPIYADEGSFRLGADSGTGKKYQWKCCTLAEVLQKKGWTSIDLLKMDIEGFEYGVLSKLPIKEIPISQILVELHFGDEYPYRYRHVIMSILKLRLSGYKLVYNALNDYTFIKYNPKN